MSQIDFEEFKQALANPLYYPEEFKAYLSDYVATHLPNIPITQVYGFHVERFREARTLNQETTTSTSYTNLTTVGPTLDKLPDGLYLVMVGCLYFPQGGGYHDGMMSFSIDGAAALDANACFGNHPGSILRVSLVDLRNPLPEHQHSLVAKYKTASLTARFSHRFLIALKVVSGVQ